MSLDSTFLKFRKENDALIEASLRFKVRNVEDREDLRSKIWGNLWKVKEHVDWETPGRAKQYLRKTEHNAVANYFRDLSREPEAESLEQLIDEDWEQPEKNIFNNRHSMEEDPLEVILKEEHLEAIAKMGNKYLRSLSTKERQVFEMVMLEDFSPAEVAKVLDMSADNVYQHLHRARGKIKKLRRSARG